MKNWLGRRENDCDEISLSAENSSVDGVIEGNLPANLPAVAESTRGGTTDVDGHVALLRRAQDAIVQAELIDAVKDIRDKAEAARKYAESASLGLEAQNYAAEVKLRAERKAGELLGELQLHGGDRRSKASVDRVTLEDVGVTKDQSSRWQLIARLPEEEFERHIADAKELARELTSTGVIRLARHMSPRKGPAPKAQVKGDGALVSDVNQLLNAEERFGCVYANPPWQSTTSGKRRFASYDTSPMSVDELCALPVEQLVTDDAHLHLWVTNASLFESPRVMRAWGFEFVSSLIWVQPQLGPGDYWRESHEVLLLGVRGDWKFKDRGVMSWVKCNRQRGRKPEKIRKLIERVSTGPYLELFAHAEVRGWTGWRQAVEVGGLSTSGSVSGTDVDGSTL